MNPPDPPSLQLLRYFSGHDTMTPGPLVIALALVTLGLGAFLLIRPAHSRKALHAFPRHLICGIVLTAICVPWFALLLNYNIPFLWMAKYRHLLVIATLLLFFPIITTMKDLLAVRALGCFLLLLGVPVLMAIRWETVDWARWITSTWVYVIIVIGMIFVLYPFRFRRWVIRFIEPSGSRTAVAGLTIVFGVALLAAGIGFLQA